MLNIKLNLPKEIKTQSEVMIQCPCGHKQKTKIDVDVNLQKGGATAQSKKVRCRKCNTMIEVVDVKKKPRFKITKEDNSKE